MAELKKAPKNNKRCKTAAGSYMKLINQISIFLKMNFGLIRNRTS